MHDIHYAGHSFPQDIETYDGCEIHDAVVGIAYYAILFFPTMYIIECTRAVLRYCIRDLFDRIRCTECVYDTERTRNA